MSPRAPELEKLALRVGRVIGTLVSRRERPAHDFVRLRVLLYAVVKTCYRNRRIWGMSQCFVFPEDALCVALLMFVMQNLVVHWVHTLRYLCSLLIKQVISL